MARGMYIVERRLKISIITVSYNAVKTIEQTIYSVVNQTYTDIEYIIIDGGSTDGTVDIIKKYSDRISRWVSEDDDGIYHAMNKGLALATGEYVFFLGADDTLLSINTINDVVRDLEQANADIYSYSVYMVHEATGMEKQVDNVKCFLGKSIPVMVPHQGLFIKTALAKKYCFDTEYKVAADYKLFLQCYFSQNVKFFYKNIPVAYFATGGLSSSQTYMLTCENEAILNELGLKHGQSRYFIKLFLAKLNVLNILKKIRDNKGCFRHICRNEKCRWCGRF